MLLLEGTHLLEEVLRTDNHPKEIIATKSWIDGHAELLRVVPEQTLVYEVTPSVLKASLTTVNPDGVATLLPLNSLPISKKEVDFVLALDRLQDPGNMGTLLRTALAADVDQVWLASGADPLSQKVLRSSAGAILHLPWQRLGLNDKDSVEALIEKLISSKKQGKQVIATIVPGTKTNIPTMPYWELDWTLPTVLLLGNEGSGLLPSLQSCCSHGVTLPHSPKVQSLNVASAAVPLLLERRRAKMISEIQQQR